MLQVGATGMSARHILVVVALASACKKTGEWVEKRASERKVERERVAAVHAAEPAQIREKPNGPGLTPGKYRLVELRLEALPTTERGMPWDPPSEPDPGPDLEIQINIGKLARTCRLPENTFAGRCELDLEFTLDAASRIDVEVIDDDAFVDDPVGRATLEEPARWGVGMTLPMMPAGRLRGATVVLVRAPTWWALYGARVLGACVGSALALFVVFSFRRTFLPPPAPPKRAPTCTHCGVLLGSSLTKCTHCGAAQQGSR